MYYRDELFQHSPECCFGVYFPCSFATREVNTKITLSWALKQFVTRTHTLVAMYLLVLWQHHAPNGNNYQAQFQPFVHKYRSFITIYIKDVQISVHIGDAINKGINPDLQAVG